MTYKTETMSAFKFAMRRLYPCERAELSRTNIAADFVPGPDGDFYGDGYILCTEATYDGEQVLVSQRHRGNGPQGQDTYKCISIEVVQEEHDEEDEDEEQGSQYDRRDRLEFGASDEDEEEEAVTGEGAELKAKIARLQATLKQTQRRLRAAEGASSDDATTEEEGEGEETEAEEDVEEVYTKEFQVTPTEDCPLVITRAVTLRFKIGNRVEVVFNTFKVDRTVIEGLTDTIADVCEGLHPSAIAENAMTPPTYADMVCVSNDAMLARKADAWEANMRKFRDLCKCVRQYIDTQIAPVAAPGAVDSSAIQLREHLTCLISEHEDSMFKVQFELWYFQNCARLDTEMVGAQVEKESDSGARYVWRSWQNALHSFQLHGDRFKKLQLLREDMVRKSPPLSTANNIASTFSPKKKKSRVALNKMSPGMVSASNCPCKCPCNCPCSTHVDPHFLVRDTGSGGVSRGCCRAAERGGAAARQRRPPSHAQRPG